MLDLEENEKQTIINLLNEASKTIGVDNEEAFIHICNIVRKIKTYSDEV